MGERGAGGRDPGLRRVLVSGAPAGAPLLLPGCALRVLPHLPTPAPPSQNTKQLLSRASVPIIRGGGTFRGPAPTGPED